MFEDQFNAIDPTRVANAVKIKTNYIVDSSNIFYVGDIVEVIDSFFWQGRQGIVTAHAIDIYSVAVEMERMDNETKLIFIHPGRIKKVG